MELSKITKKVEEARLASLSEQSNTSKNLDIILNIVNTINKTFTIEKRKHCQTDCRKNGAH